MSIKNTDAKTQLKAAVKMVMFFTILAIVMSMVAIIMEYFETSDRPTPIGVQPIRSFIKPYHALMFVGFLGSCVSIALRAIAARLSELESASGVGASSDPQESKKP